MENPFGFVIIDKPSGLTSHDCVNRLRHVFGIKRIGHGGTLDPAVTGVLPIAIGHATRLLPYLPGDKIYRGVIQLGKQTNTDDLEGVLIASKELPKLETKNIEEYLHHFRGVIKQCPPQFSSVHSNGLRAHQRARRGEVMDLKARKVNIHELTILRWSPEKGQLEVDIHCSSGTYIRSIARDLGLLIGCGGCLARLQRIEALGFNIKEAVTLPNRESKSSCKPEITSPLMALRHLPRFKLTKTEVNLWRTGQHISCKDPRRFCDAADKQLIDTPENTKTILIIDNKSEVAGIAHWENDFSILKPKVVFNAKG